MLLVAALCPFIAVAQKQFTLYSPDKGLQTDIFVGDSITYRVSDDGALLIDDSPLSMTLADGRVWGEKSKLAGTSRRSVDEMVASPFYRADRIADRYNALTLRFKGGWNVEFRAYNDGVAYRFVYMGKKPIVVKNEKVVYNFPNDAEATVPYVRGGKDGNFQEQFRNSFENLYTVAPLSKLNTNRLAFLPLAVDAGGGRKVGVTEADLQNYPGLYLRPTGGKCLTGMFAPYPKRLEQNYLRMVVKEGEDYIAKVDGACSFPWRVAVISASDKDLAASNLSYLLAEPSRIADTSWIKPGKVAWEWWSGWTLYGVDFKTGVNTATYKAYIDFASHRGIEYVILDRGWAENPQADIMQVVPEIDLKEIIDYGKSKNVGIILWAGYYAFARDMEKACSHYAGMGVKGFKIDYMDRDDQLMTDFNYRAAAMCAKYKLLVNFHGVHMPAGMNRTYPNALNFEGVHGLEQMKWAASSVDQVTYDCRIPFLRQLAGPMDYTQGAMRNASKGNYHPCYTEPMSQGTRCRQLAMYMVFDSPLTMLCDTPSNYDREGECTDFIAGIPTTWDETLVLDGRMGDYVVTARRKGTTWYVGGITDTSARDIEIDLSFLPAGTHNAVLFRDGANAHRIGRDYKRMEMQVENAEKLKFHLAPGGGFALKID